MNGNGILAKYPDDVVDLSLAVVKPLGLIKTYDYIKANPSIIIKGAGIGRCYWYFVYIMFFT